MGSVHELIDTHGRRNAVDHVKGKRAPRIVQAAHASMLDEQMGLVSNLVYSGWCHAGLPHRKTADDARWTIKTDYVTLVVEPGAVPGEEPGTYRHIGVPYGPIARLILIYLQTRALETGSREVELGKSLRQFLTRLGLTNGGKTQKIIRDQVQRISHCRLTFHLQKDGVRGVSNQAIVDTAVFFDDRTQDDDRQTSLFTDTIKLSEGFFQQLRRHAVTLDEGAIRKIHNNSRALDAYCWLAFRLAGVPKETTITWAALRPQFGGGISSMVEFKRTFADDVRLATSVYPDAKVELGPNGLTLRPSPPPISPKAHRLALR